MSVILLYLIKSALKRLDGPRLKSQLVQDFPFLVNVSNINLLIVVADRRCVKKYRPLALDSLLDIYLVLLHGFEYVPELFVFE